jgi:ATP-binding cassette subfamily B multidrug efflux pump
MDITQLSRQDLRGFIRTMTQDAYLFSDTIEKNVRFGSSGANLRSDSDVQEVLNLSELSDDIARFTKGDQTVVGEKGIMLSGGQKQRLSIARALFTPSDLIIMDNVLSAVDYETERKILAAVISGVSGQSLLVVSHRVSALESMDNILVLQKGEIIAQGTHQALLSSSEYYLNTWRLQQQDAKDTQ